MTAAIRSLCAGGLVIGVCVLAAPNATAQGRSMKDYNKVEKVQKKIQKSDRKVAKTVARRTSRRTVRRTRVLCADGVWVYRSAYTCRSHGGIASYQGHWSVFPPASDRAREVANEASAVQRGIRSYPWADNVSRGAVARCNDGTYWHSYTRRGACYRHGGVAVWL